MKRRASNQEFSSIAPHKHSFGFYVGRALKYLLALAAALNLVALFGFRYQLPAWLRQSQNEVIQPGASTAAPVVAEKLILPVIPLNYSGEADLDEMVMENVYLVGEDRLPVEDAVISYEILPGESRQKKILRYSVTLGSGEVLTQDRTMQLTARYTGPNITLLGMLPDIDPAESDAYLDQLIRRNLFRADDGFGNDVTTQVTVVFDGLSDEAPSAGMTLQLENQVHDTYEKSLTVNVLNYTGVVLTLSQSHVTLQTGDAFDPRSYIAVAHDTAGNDLTGRVTVDSGVNPYAAGDYEVWYWVEDDDGVFSPIKKLYVTVEGSTVDTPETAFTPAENQWTDEDGITWWGHGNGELWWTTDDGQTWYAWRGGVIRWTTDNGNTWQ